MRNGSGVRWSDLKDLRQPRAGDVTWVGRAKPQWVGPSHREQELKCHSFTFHTFTPWQTLECSLIFNKPHTMLFSSGTTNAWKRIKHDEFCPLQSAISDQTWNQIFGCLLVSISVCASLNSIVISSFFTLYTCVWSAHADDWRWNKIEIHWAAKAKDYHLTHSTWLLLKPAALTGLLSSGKTHSQSLEMLQ